MAIRTPRPSIPWILVAALLLVSLAACAPAASRPEPSGAALDARTPPVRTDASANGPAFVPVDRAPVIDGAQPHELVDPDSGRVTYAERLGAGPQVVLVHGIGGGSSVYQYRRVAPVLAHAGYAVVAIDLYGFGRSTRPVGGLTGDELVAQIEAVLDGLDAPHTHLVANGLAAAYAIRVAVERPEAVASLSLIAPTGLGRLDRDRATADAAFDVFGGPLGAVLYGALLGPDVQLRFLLDAYADPANVTDEVRATYARNLYVRNARWAVLSFVSGLLDQDVRDLWPRVDAPTWIAWGRDAETTPASDAVRFLDLRPDTPMIVYDGAKLLPNVERADAYVTDLQRFLALRMPWGAGPEPVGR